MNKNNFKEKLYSIYSRMYCSGSIYVNDVPVIEHYGNETIDGGYGREVVINNVLLESGIYKISGKMFPRKGNMTLTEDNTMMLQFYCADKDSWKASRFEFHSKIESPWDGLSENITYPSYEISTEIEIELPYVLDGWQNSADLSKVDKTTLFEEVLDFYKQIHMLLKTGNATKFLELSREKLNLNEQAFYFSEERKNNFMKNMTALFHEGVTVEPFSEKELILEIMGNGRLVRLMKVDKTHPLKVKSTNTDDQNIVEIELNLHKRIAKKGLSII